MNTNITKILTIVAVVLLCFVSYKMGDKNGYREGFDYGYSLDCRDDLRKVGTYAAKTRSAVDSVNTRIENIRIDMNVPDSLRWESFAGSEDFGRAEYYKLSNIDKSEFKKAFLARKSEEKNFTSRASTYMKENSTHEYQEELPNGMGYKGVKKMGK